MQAFADFSDSLIGGLLLLALSMALGSVVWGLAVLRAWRGGVPASLARRAVTLLAAGALGVAACQLVALGLKVVVLSGYLGEQSLPRFAGTVQFRAGAAQAALALGLAVAAGWLRSAPASRGRWAVVALLALLLATSGAWLVHAAGRLASRAPLMALTVLHQIGAAAWVGGLVQLLAAWRLGRRDDAVAARWPVLVRGFSRVAMASVALLLAAAAPLTWVYVGSPDGLIGSGYGSLVVTKTMLMGAALLLGALSFATGRSRARIAIEGRVPYYAEAEAILLVILLFAAASLASQPPPVDVTSERATWSEVVEVFRPKWPDLRTPSVAVMIAQDSVAAATPIGVERTPEAYLWSNFSHNVAGMVLLVMGGIALVAAVRPRSWARHWPAGFVVLACFVMLRTSANDGIWPFGSVGFWQSMWGDAEVLQHRIGAFLALGVGVLEWRARANGSTGRITPYVFPVLAALGGVLLLTHSHAAFEIKRYYLVQVTHTVMGALAVLMACTRLLELRLPAPAGRLAGVASSLAMLLIALVLVFYREANVVLMG